MTFANISSWRYFTDCIVIYRIMFKLDLITWCLWQTIICRHMTHVHKKILPRVNRLQIRGISIIKVVQFPSSIAICFHFWRTQILFVGPLISLFWTSGDVCPVFQSHGEFPTCVFSCLCTMDSSDSPLCVCLDNQCTCRHIHKHWWCLNTQPNVPQHSALNHSATPARLE